MESTEKIFLKETWALQVNQDYGNINFSLWFIILLVTEYDSTSIFFFFSHSFFSSLRHILFPASSYHFNSQIALNKEIPTRMKSEWRNCKIEYCSIFITFGGKNYWLFFSISPLFGVQIETYLEIFLFFCKCRKILWPIHLQTSYNLFFDISLFTSSSFSISSSFMN